MINIINKVKAHLRAICLKRGAACAKAAVDRLVQGETYEHLFHRSDWWFDQAGRLQ